MYILPVEQKSVATSTSAAAAAPGAATDFGTRSCPITIRDTAYFPNKYAVYRNGEEESAKGELHSGETREREKKGE